MVNVIHTEAPNVSSGPLIGPLLGDHRTPTTVAGNAAMTEGSPVFTQGHT